MAHRRMDIRRVVNHALAWLELGDREQCARLLKKQIAPDWPKEEVRRERAMIAGIEAPEH